MDLSRRAIPSNPLPGHTHQDSGKAPEQINERATCARSGTESAEKEGSTSNRLGTRELQGPEAAQDIGNGQPAPRLQARRSDRVGAEAWATSRRNDSGDLEPVPTSHDGQLDSDDRATAYSPYIRTRNLPASQRAISIAETADQSTQACINATKAKLRKLLLKAQATKHELSDERRMTILAGVATLVDSIRTQIAHNALPHSDKAAFFKSSGESHDCHENH